MKLLITCLSICITTICLAQEGQLKKYETQEFSFEYPSDWEFDDSGVNGAQIMLSSQPDNADDLFRENVNLIIQDVSGFDVTLEDYIEMSIPELVGIGAEIVDNVTFEKPAKHKVVFNIKQSGYDLRMVQYYLVKNGTAYVLTLTCLRNESDNYWEMGQKILESFTVKNPKADKK